MLADPHAGQDPAADARLLEVFGAAARAGADLWLLGDLFVAWLAPERFWTPRQRALLEGLEAVRAAGGRVDFVVGNRDYLCEALLGRVFDAVYVGEVVAEVAGQPTLLCHGDRLNAADWPYRTWHALSRSRPVTAALRALPGRLGQRLAARTERRMAGVNTRYKTGLLPLPALEALGRRAAARGARRALVGHFHHDRLVPVAGGAPVQLAPGWCDHERLLVAGPAGRLGSVPAADLLGHQPPGR